MQEGGNSGLLANVIRGINIDSKGNKKGENIDETGEKGKIMKNGLERWQREYARSKYRC
jgi:hypothetical protein